MKTKVKVVFTSPVYTLGYRDPKARANASETRGPFDRVSRWGRRLTGVTCVPGQADKVVVISEEDDVYGGAMRGQVKCHKVDGCVDMDDAYFEAYLIAAVDQFEPERSPGQQAIIDGVEAIGPQTTQHERRSWRMGQGSAEKTANEVSGEMFGYTN